MPIPKPCAVLFSGVRNARCVETQHSHYKAIATRSSRISLAGHLNSASIRSAEGVSQIELYLDGTRLGLVTVVVQNRQRHLAVERLATEPPDPPKPKSSLDYLAVLRAEYQAQQQRELGPLQFTQLSLPEADTPADPTPEA